MGRPVIGLALAALLAAAQASGQEPEEVVPGEEAETEEIVSAEETPEESPAHVAPAEAPALAPVEAEPAPPPAPPEPDAAAAEPAAKEPAGEVEQEEPADDDETDGLSVPLWGGLSFGLGGYYRVRGVFVRDLHMFLKNPTASSDAKRMRGDVDYFIHRLRLEPVLRFKDLAKLEIWIHAFDNVIWGDNAGLAEPGLFAGEPSNTDYYGNDVPALTMPAAWVELNVLVGVIRAGRMPSDWGLGLLTDGGGGFDDDFGWNDAMSISDRVLFATMPVAIVQKIAKSKAEPFPLYLAVAYDKLVTEDIAVASARIPYTTAWLSEYKDDVDSFTAALAYSGEDLDWIGSRDSLAAGFYYVQRWQHVTKSRIHIIDWFLKLHLGPAFAEYEHYYILGHSQAIPLLPSATSDPDDWLRERAEAKISAWLARVGYDWRWFRFKLEAGYASGDGNFTDESFTVRPVNPNIRVGLVLYQQMLAEITRNRWGDNPGMWSKGGIINSYFFMQSVRYEPIDGLEIILALLQAWRDKADGALIPDDTGSSFLGFETDLAVKYHFHGGHAHLGIEGGLLRVGQAFKDPVLNMPDHTWTVQVWTAFTP
jgi:hypothetical protein